MRLEEKNVFLERISLSDLANKQARGDTNDERKRVIR